MEKKNVCFKCGNRFKFDDLIRPLKTERIEDGLYCNDCYEKLKQCPLYHWCSINNKRFCKDIDELKQSHAVCIPMEKIYYELKVYFGDD